MTFTAHSEPREADRAIWYCAACGASFTAVLEALPDICPACQSLTTYRETPPRRPINWTNTHGLSIASDHPNPENGVRTYSYGPFGIGGRHSE